MAQLVKNPPANAGDLGLIPGLGRSPGEGKDYPLQYSGLENSMDCTVHGVTKSQTRLSDFHFLYSLVRKFSLIRLKLLSGCVSPVCCFLNKSPGVVAAAGKLLQSCPTL